MAELRGHTDSVTCVRAWTDEMLLSASYDATVRQGRRAMQAGNGDAWRDGSVRKQGRAVLRGPWMPREGRQGGGMQRLPCMHLCMQHLQ